jgi:DNA (cytosine-5)-methyltransferase 1
MIIGGPPCQTFSASGRRAGGAPGQLDERGNLFRSYCKVVEFLKPKAFLFENVRGILGTNKGKDFEEIVSSFAALYYTI